LKVEENTTMSTLTDFESRFLPVFRNMATELSAEFPRVHANVWSYPVGALTDYQGHGLGVECSIPTNPMDPAEQVQLENVALMINLKHLSTQPEVDSVTVSWGSGQVEARLVFDDEEISEKLIVEIENGLPKLFDVLKSAVTRGHPAEN
jgi:hypothetical protein